ncbi:MAG: ribokinase [Treponema sp.]|nr:ribokinase [Treponema sp.]MCL2271851.1 ribokinase [Treponema sp.]
MKVLVYGSLNIDLLFFVDHIASPGETISSSSFERSAGGKGANQAAALAKAGLSVTMAGKIGHDGLFLLKLLESYGVDTSAVIRSDGATGQAIIQIDKNGQNCIVLYSGGNGEITLDEIEKTIAGFNAGDIIVLQNEIVHTGKIMERAKKQKMRICFNPSPFNEKIASLPLHTVDWLFVNEIEGAALAKLPPDTEPQTALDRLVKLFPSAEIILTAGNNGAFYGYGEKRESRGIVKSPVVDTTGAGDTFTGFFLAAREKNFSAAQSLAIAGKAASIAVSRKGAMESIPFEGEVFNIDRHLKN